MKKLILIPIVLIICALLYIFVFKNKTYVQIQDDGVYYGMSTNKLIKIKGDPVEIKNEPGDTPFKQYLYNEVIENFDAKNVYGFKDSFFSQQLFYVMSQIDTKSKEKGILLFHKLYNDLTNYYENKKNYYNNGIKEENENELSATLGTDDGAIGISIELSYSNNIVYINAIDME